MQAQRDRRSGFLWIVLLALLAAALLLILPRQLPALDQVRPGSHAVQRHGTDAIAARTALSECGEGLRVKLCPPGSQYGLSVVFWCETGGPLCAGCITTFGGVEKTSFMRPCAQWRECR